MKILLVGIFVSMFALTPLFLFNAIVMPELQSMQQNYTNVDEIADRAVNGNGLASKN